MRAYATYKGSRGWHPDLATFYASRYRLYCDLVGVYPDDSEYADTDLMNSKKPHLKEKHVMHSYLLTEIATRFEELSAPWAGVLVAPKPVITVVNRYDESIKVLIRRQQEIYLDAMTDAAEFIWGPCPRTVSADELDQHNVGTAHEPNWAAYC